MPAKRSNEPFLWSLFSSGGMIAALLLPVMLFLFGVAFPLGWIAEPGYRNLLELFRNPIVKLGLFVMCSLPLFHWAHRFRFTLYDGLQIKHLNELIFLICYGGAVAGTLLAAWLLWNL
ncbi:MAG TPA: fumarate reductase subunit FrdD [Blastocatellia bacterium]|nr:fumarate reductase subunit FrdD [Blastocatellia bacterium]